MNIKTTTMQIPVILVGVIFIFDYCDSNTTPHTYGSQFYGHELLHKEVLLDKLSETPENYTLTFTYTDKEDQLVTFVKFQINDSNCPANLKYKNKSMEAILHIYDAYNVTATAYVYGFNQKNMTSHFIKRLYEEKKNKTQPLSFVLNFEYLKNEEDAL